MRLFAIGTAIVVQLAAAGAAGAEVCPSGSDYEDGLCAFTRGDYVAAESIFQRITEANAQEPVTMKAAYFLARTKMKLGKHDAASSLLIWIYTHDPGFYREWACDHLLGEARERRN